MVSNSNSHQAGSPTQSCHTLFHLVDNSSYMRPLKTVAQFTSDKISAASTLPWNMVARPRTPATLPTPNICNSVLYSFRMPLDHTSSRTCPEIWEKRGRPNPPSAHSAFVTRHCHEGRVRTFLLDTFEPFSVVPFSSRL